MGEGEGAEKCAPSNSKYTGNRRYRTHIRTVYAGHLIFEINIYIVYKTISILVYYKSTIGGGEGFDDYFIIDIYFNVIYLWMRIEFVSSFGLLKNSNQLLNK